MDLGCFSNWPPVLLGAAASTPSYHLNWFRTRVSVRDRVNVQGYRKPTVSGILSLKMHAKMSTTLHQPWSLDIVLIGYLWWCGPQLQLQDASQIGLALRLGLGVGLMYRDLQSLQFHGRWGCKRDASACAALYEHCFLHTILI